MVSSIAAAGLYRGTWREDMFDEAQNLDTHPYFRTKHESERVVREECKRPWRVYRPGIVVGNSETGEMDKIDGPYYFFKLIRRIRQVVPAWMPMPGVEGREINIVPVDFVVKAMDHIAHLDGLDGRAFSLTDPDPLSAGEVIDVFARAAHAPQSTVRAPASATEALQPLPDDRALERPVRQRAHRSRARRLRHPALGAALPQLPDPFRLAPHPGRAGRAPGSRCRRSRPTPASSGTTGPAISTPTSTATGRWSERPAAGAGVIGGLAQILEQQIPDEVMRFGRRLQGNTSLEKEVSGKVVLVTGASSGIGKAAAMKIADAGGIVLLVARTPEKLEETRDQIADGGGIAHIHRCDLSDVDDIDRMADEVLEQHGNVDVLINNAGRSIRRSIALSYDRFHDFERTMQLNYFGPVRLILRLLPTMRQRRSGQIINVSSIGVQTNMPRFSAYVASKSALDAFSRCIASEIIDDKVKHHDDPHAAGADADDRADEDVRPLPDDHARRGGRHALRRDHLQAEADRDAGRHARADPLRDQPEVDRLHPQQRLPHVPGLDRREGRASRRTGRRGQRGAPRPTSRPTTSSSPSRT